MECITNLFFPDIFCLLHSQKVWQEFKITQLPIICQEFLLASYPCFSMHTIKSGKLFVARNVCIHTSHDNIIMTVLSPHLWLSVRCSNYIVAMPNASSNDQTHDSCIQASPEIDLERKNLRTLGGNGINP